MRGNVAPKTMGGGVKASSQTRDTAWYLQPALDVVGVLVEYWRKFGEQPAGRIPGVLDNLFHQISYTAKHNPPSRAEQFLRPKKTTSDGTRTATVLASALY
jgi:hypothetical protein